MSELNFKRGRLPTDSQLIVILSNSAKKMIKLYRKHKVKKSFIKETKKKHFNNKKRQNKKQVKSGENEL